MYLTFSMRFIALMSSRYREAGTVLRANIRSLVTNLQKFWFLGSICLGAFMPQYTTWSFVVDDVKPAHDQSNELLPVFIRSEHDRKMRSGP